MSDRVKKGHNAVMKNTKAILFLIFSLCPTFALGYNLNPQDWKVGAHLLALHIDDIQVDDQGTKNGIDPDLFLSLEANWQLEFVHEKLSWNPSFGLGLPHSGRDEDIKRWQYFINSPLRYSWLPELQTHFGPGLFMTRLSSDGGTAELENGTNPSTSFFLPQEGSTSMNLIWSVGGRWEFRPNFSVGTDLIFFNLTESISRTLSASLSFHYSFGEDEK